VIVLRPKIRLEDIKEFKIERKVFDHRTLLSIFNLMKKGYVETVETIVKEGKESVVVAAKDRKDNWLALKVYRTLHCDFKSMWKYLAGDPRFKNIKKNRWLVVKTWCRREFKNLKIAFKAKVNCPKPIAFNNNVLAMSFIGEKAISAPRIVDIILKQRDLKKIYGLILNEMKKLAKVKLIHTDLSPYNILIFDKPYLIDFSQAVTEKHPLAKEFLKRDVKNINNYFKKRGIKINSNIFDDLVKIIGLE
jgi:RIO kinase 1